jgi:hypothetical protein
MFGQLYSSKSLEGEINQPINIEKSLIKDIVEDVCIFELEV